MVTMALSCIISAIKQDIGRKLRFFHTSQHSMPLLGMVWYGYTTFKKV